MKIVLCGPIISENLEMYLPQASPAAGKYLRNLVKGLEKNDCEVNSISFLTIPVSKDIKINKIDNINKIHYIFKDKCIIPSILNYRKQILSYSKKDSIVIFYNQSYATWGMVNKLKKKGIKSLLILADHTPTEEYKSIIRKLIARGNEKEFKKFDYSIILSPNVKKFLNINSQVLLLEGGIDLKKFEKYTMSSISEKIVVMYAGLLSEVTGIDIFLEAIKQNKNQNIEFRFSGKGELSQSVKDLAMVDKRVKFLGFLSNKDFYTEMNNANILINPRNMKLIQNQNNFPSKILEYLATGKIIISSKFAGYYNFNDNIIFFDGSASDLNLKIEYIIENFEHLAPNFYQKNRLEAQKYDWFNQTQKILDMVQNK